MGAALSTPLAEWSAAEVAEQVKGIGKMYEGYVAAILENGMDGKTVEDMASDLDGLLDDLGVERKIHRSRLRTAYLSTRS